MHQPLQPVLRTRMKNMRVIFSGAVIFFLPSIHAFSIAPQNSYWRSKSSRQGSNSDVFYTSVSEDIDDSGDSSDFDLLAPLLDNTIVNGYQYNYTLPLESWHQYMKLPRHASHDGVNDILTKVESLIVSLHSGNDEGSFIEPNDKEKALDTVYANSYVDFGKVDTVGFDYDYTLVTYKQEVLSMIYDMALKRLVHRKFYPNQMLSAGLKFDPQFSIRGLAVDRELGWICHLTYTHKVAVAWEGRQRVPREKLMEEYAGKRSLRPSERRKRLKPLNDLFSMAECCLIADTVQYFKDHNIPFCPKNAVADILEAIASTHISGDFHRVVAENPAAYFEPQPYLSHVLEKLKESDKRLIFVSNSPYWYVDAGMKYVIGENWRDTWDAIIVSAGKPSFYTEDSRPFREVCTSGGQVQFKKITKLEPGRVYTEGCLKELTKCLVWNSSPYQTNFENDIQTQITGGSTLASPNVLYVGDSLFADLVDAKREFGWTTAAVIPEVSEIELQSKPSFLLAQRTQDLLLYALRKIQPALGNGCRTKDDIQLMNELERLVSIWREEQNKLLRNPFGSVFKAKYQPSLFAHSLRRYCDLYLCSVAALRHYSPQHRFYPENGERLLSHEVSSKSTECWMENLL